MLRKRAHGTTLAAAVALGSLMACARSPRTARPSLARIAQAQSGKPMLVFVGHEL